jgi:hypothetical protein
LRFGIAGTALLAALGVVPAALAASGRPDPSYGKHGVSIQSGVGEEANALIQAGSSVVVFGFTGASANSHGRLVAGKLSVLKLGPHGKRVRHFGTVLRVPQLVDVDGAVRESGGRFVVATSVTPNDRYPCRIELHGFDAHGHVDRSFGSSGVVRLSTMGCGVKLLRAPDGTLLMAGESTTATNALTGMQLVRVSPSGHELGATVAPVSGDLSEGAISGAVVSPNGATTLVGTDSGGQAFLGRFTPQGQLDQSYGHQGVRRLSLKNVQIDAAALDHQGRLLLGGSRLVQTEGGPEPGAAMLARVTLAGVVDRKFSRGGAARIPHEIALDAVRPGSGNKVLAASDDGAVLRFTSTGKLDRSFGRSGRSILPPSDHGSDPLYRVSDLLLTSKYAYVAASKYRVYKLAVERVRLG